MAAAPSLASLILGADRVACSSGGNAARAACRASVCVEARAGSVCRIRRVAREEFRTETAPAAGAGTRCRLQPRRGFTAAPCMNPI